ncbi:MAG TPA: pitrilysin family protein [Thermoanaerobaculia bacterium]|nr:pitrilysin family protein [Thermoanaerobaculia bacterium]
MKSLRFAVGGLLLAASAFAASLTIPPIHYRHRTLSNGLDVYSAEDHATPTVSIQVWYRVGSKDDPQHRSGFAHLFEHMMFKSTAHMKAEMMDRLTEDVGGFNNATTFDDATPYYEVVPSNYLETLLWAEADRMGSLNVDEANFKSERDVVKEEYRYRILAPPYGRFYYAITKHSFAKHPYKRPGIGSIEDLDASTLEDVRRFHDTYYRPDNADLIVVGDFDPAQLDAWVDQYFGPIAKPSRSIPRVETKEPSRPATKRVVEHGPNVPLPAVAITWLTPPASSSDAAALNVAAAILGKGESSRLYQSLVYKKQVAQEIEADADLKEDVGLFGVLAIMATGHDAKEGEQELRAQLKSLAEKRVKASELTKAKNLLLTDALKERETNNGKAFAIGQAIVLTRNAEEVNRGLEKLQAVTAADVQRVMRKYVQDAKSVVIAYEGGAK